MSVLCYFHSLFHSMYTSLVNMDVFKIPMSILVCHIPDRLNVILDTANQYGMASTSSYILNHLQLLGLYTRQFICNTSKSTTANICVTSSTCRSMGMGSRCDIPRLVKNATACISAICSDNHNSRTNISTLCHNTVNSTSMAKTVMVSQSTSVVC